MIQFDEHVFEMGWFNHQLEKTGRCYCQTTMIKNGGGADFLDHLINHGPFLKKMVKLVNQPDLKMVAKDFQG